MQNSEPVMLRLSQLRTIFHSEADFQHAFAWELHKMDPTASVSLERPYKTNGANLHLDMLFQSNGRSLAVELKYKTLKLQHGTDEHGYQLLDQSAQDVGRYDFIKDIWRLEAITKAVPNCIGWAILLTNDAGYWKPPSRENTVDSSFRLTDGATLSGTRSWGNMASAGTMKNREKPLALNGAYKLIWRDYSVVSPDRNGKFKYLALRVANDG
jgi:hypothetical protein